jgi:hypothetical protein
LDVVFYRNWSGMANATLDACKTKFRVFALFVPFEMPSNLFAIAKK